MSLRLLVRGAGNSPTHVFLKRARLQAYRYSLPSHDTARLLSRRLYCDLYNRFSVQDSAIYHHCKLTLPLNNGIIRRHLSTAPLPQNRSRIVRFLYRSSAFLGIFVAVCGGLVVTFFIYDYSTYREDLSSVDIPVSDLALHPRRGGPKNLPIIEHFIDDDESETNKNQKHKPKLVLLGTGWGNIPLLKQLNSEDFHVTIVSPSNYFIFTPMLPSATVGTLELRSLMEPVRRVVARVKGRFLKGTAEDIDFSAKLVEVSSTSETGEKQLYYLPYDKLVIGVGKSDETQAPDNADHVDRLYHE